MLNTPWVIWLPAVTNAFNIFLLKRFFDSIPEDLMAAAAIDGAGPLRTLWSIILPMSRPIIGVVVDLLGHRRVEGLPLADAGRAVAGHEDGQRRHLRVLQGLGAERGDRGAPSSPPSRRSSSS